MPKAMDDAHRYTGDADPLDGQAPRRPARRGCSAVAELCGEVCDDHRDAVRHPGDGEIRRPRRRPAMATNGSADQVIQDRPTHGEQDCDRRSLDQPAGRRPADGQVRSDAVPSRTATRRMRARPDRRMRSRGPRREVTDIGIAPQRREDRAEPDDDDAGGLDSRDVSPAIARESGCDGTFRRRERTHHPDLPGLYGDVLRPEPVALPRPAISRYGTWPALGRVSPMVSAAMGTASTWPNSITPASVGPAPIIRMRASPARSVVVKQPAASSPPISAGSGVRPHGCASLWSGSRPQAVWVEARRCEPTKGGDDRRPLPTRSGDRPGRDGDDPQGDGPPARPGSRGQAAPPEAARDADLASRFRREALAATVLRHPNIVACLDTGTDGDQPYLVMDLVDGEDLAARLKRGGRLPPSVAARIGLDVARALGVAHVRGIVHRDVKPGNILLAADGRAMVTDFGIARLAADAEAVQPGTTLGSVHYFSPEQARGATTTPGIRCLRPRAGPVRGADRDPRVRRRDDRRDRAGRIGARRRRPAPSVPRSRRSSMRSCGGARTRSGRPLRERQRDGRGARSGRAGRRRHEPDDDHGDPEARR